MTRIVENSKKKFITPGLKYGDPSNPKHSSNIKFLSPTQKANLAAAQKKLRSEGDFFGSRLIGRDSMDAGTMRFVGHDELGNKIFEGPELPSGPTPPPSKATARHFERIARNQQQASESAAKDAAMESAKAAEEATRLANRRESPVATNNSSEPVGMKRGGKVKGWGMARGARAAKIR